MARITERNKIRKHVCLSAIFNTKEPKRFDVVNIKRTSSLCFWNLAKLAHMAIPFPALPSLSEPVRPVIERVASVPCGVPCAVPVIGLPPRKAFSVTKIHPILTGGPISPDNDCPAVPTFNGDRCPSGGLGTDEFPYKCSSHAVLTAIFSVRSSICRRSVKRYPAICTSRIITFPGDTIRVRDSFPIPDFLPPCIYIGASFLGVFDWHRPSPQLKVYHKNGESMGIGSEGFQAVKMGRKFVGAELKASYFGQACRNLRSAENAQHGGLFDDEVA